jgi:hypothetical protein
MPYYELGPCQLYNNTDGRDLGKTEGGVILNIEESYQTLNSDQDGETPIDESITGTTVTVVGNLADISLANLAFALKETVVNESYVKITPNAGTSLLSNAKEICIKPYVDGVPTTNEKRMILIPKAGIRASLSMQYDDTNQRVINFTLTGYPDNSLAGALAGTDVVAVFGASSSTSSVF